MSTILTNDLINGCPEEEFSIMLATFSQNKTEELHKLLHDFATEHFKKISGKMCWKKYHYFGIISPGAYERSKRSSWKRMELNAILASEKYNATSKWPRCKVFRTSRHGSKERRSQWFEIHRSRDNPILSSGWKFNDYDIFEVPEEFFAFAYDFLPKHQPNIP